MIGQRAQRQVVEAVAAFEERDDTTAAQLLREHASSSLAIARKPSVVTLMRPCVSLAAASWPAETRMNSGRKRRSAGATTCSNAYR